MQWNSSKNSGFSTSSKTWLQINPSFKDTNVEVNNKKKDSKISFELNKPIFIIFSNI
jgi:alpha-glucosidase